MDKGGLLKKAALSLWLYVVLAAAVPAFSSIFTRRPAGGDIVGWLRTLGGQSAYTTPVRINGAPAVLTVTGFDDPQNSIASEIGAVLSLHPLSPGGDSLYVIERPGTVTRLLLLRPARGNKTMAVTIEQTAAAFHQRQHDPVRQPPDSPLPLFPGATAGLCAKNEDTGLYFAILTASVEPSSIADYYRSSLAAAGWLPAFPEADSRSGLILLRKNALCMVIISPSNDAATTRITLLYKPFQSPSS